MLSAQPTDASTEPEKAVYKLMNISSPDSRYRLTCGSGQHRKNVVQRYAMCAGCTAQATSLANNHVTLYRREGDQWCPRLCEGRPEGHCCRQISLRWFFHKGVPGRSLVAKPDLDYGRLHLPATPNIPSGALARSPSHLSVQIDAWPWTQPA